MPYAAAGALILALLLSSGAAAQRPGSLEGRVVDGATGSPVEGARVELVELGRTAPTDAAGRYRFRAVEAGRHTVRATAVGYSPGRATVVVESGRAARLDLELAPRALPLPALAVTTARRPADGARIDRTEIAASGARSAGDVVGSVPGVVVRSAVPGGPQTVSIRGGGSDAVLVLVDGAPINDPITGEADLSTIPAGSIESVTVLTGARSARYGPRAEAGVILIATRREGSERMLAGGVGALGARMAAARWGGRAPLAWSAGVGWRSVDGGFDYALPVEAGGGAGRRENADLDAFDAFLAASDSVAGGSLRTRAGFEAVERGLPGRGFAPSRFARQRLDRARASAAWRRLGRDRATSVVLGALTQRVRFRDAEPPFGLPYDDTTALRSVRLRAETRRRPAGGLAARWGTGAEARWERIESDALADHAPRDRLDLGAFLHGGLEPRVLGVTLAATGRLRVDRDPAAGGWALNRSLAVGVRGSNLALRLANRSSYSPPTLGDRFFRQGVAVEPNPALRAERVPSEVELAARAHGRLGPVAASLELSAYRADVEDMIVWAPDHRFVWSPRNVDVDRRGGEVRAEVETPDRRLRLSGGYAYTRVVYDRGGGDDTVQVAYRPRHTADLLARWTAGPWHLRLEAEFTGRRYPAAAPVNALPSFWTVSGGASRDWPIGSWSLAATVRVDRIFDDRSSLIFGFPEPGRRLRLGLELSPGPPTPLNR